MAKDVKKVSESIKRAVVQAAKVAVTADMRAGYAISDYRERRRDERGNR